MRSLLLAILLALLLSLLAAGDTPATTLDSVQDETYPEDIDLLEEIIQSYYLLLDSENAVQQYDMINQDANVISNEEQALGGFYTKLAELHNGKRDRVTVFQFGDSHIQPGYMSGTARASLQRYFGNAGRGLVFPWKLAGTNQPDDIRIKSNCVWKRAFEGGICGYGLNTGSTGNLLIQTNNFFQTDNSFDQITLITEEEDNSYQWKVTGLAEDEPDAVSSFAEQSVYQLSWVNPTSVAELTFQANNPRDNAHLYGIILERQQPGLMYHAMGINGASFDKFNKMPEFFPQIKLLTPDLIIVSLGTNDTQGRFREEAYLKTVKTFMKNLRYYVPGVPVLFTFPPDSHKNGRHNADIEKADKLLADYARENKCAWWDLPVVMGGKGSITRWRSRGLANGDYKHFTPKGYMLQGQLLYQALIKGYKTYAEKR